MSDTLLSENPAFRISMGYHPVRQNPGQCQVGTVALRLPFHLDASFPKNWPSSRGLQGSGRRNTHISILVGHLVKMSRGSGLGAVGALGKALELLELQLLCLLNGNERLCVMKVHPGHIVTSVERLAHSEHLVSGSCYC